MSLIGFHYSAFFKEALLTGKMSGTVLKGEYKFPISSKLFVYLSPDNAETSILDTKVGVATIKACKVLPVSELTDKIAQHCAYTNETALREDIKKWYNCGDSDKVTFVEYEFEKLAQ